MQRFQDIRIPRKQVYPIKKKKDYRLLALIIVSLLAVVTVFACTSSTEKYVAPVDEPAERQSVQLSPKLQIVKKIADTFPEQPRTMVAIALQESSLNPQAVSYNCYYAGYWTATSSKPIITNYTPLSKKTKGVVSWFCKSGHEKYAWSKDGGLMQIHNPEPKDFNIDENLKEAREKYDTQGIDAWSSYNLGHYKKHLAQADKLLSELSTK